MSDPETIRVYDARATDYAKLDPRDEPDGALAAFIAAVTPGGHVLDLGCGPGRSAGLMARAGLRVEAWDASAEMVALADLRDGVTARHAQFDDLTAASTFDGVWANFSLLHATRDAMPLHIAAIARALRPNGVFHIALKEGTGEARDKIGRFYTYWEEEPLCEVLRAEGLTPGPLRRGIGKGLDGSDAAWFSLIAHG